ncbi:MAG: T9SS type A sorting domain-containing protein [Candidatus Marinimicrobia bacterium]|nr:T9SS type A sorting domain-containing protein [Candidatus Neomarinimicrobiota bacterium]MDP7464703.1 T9SS type A sorting domain-containing protein [Candidatus Neomarinimicrobiota bacterium]HJN69178.1 T9SS type A sorting domain-containing protein [Candidatus Neomarinimicrobiota bacterium]
MKKIATLKESKMGVLFLIALVSTACWIAEVEQPAQVNAGETFTTIVTVSNACAESGTPHPGAMAVMVPDDWWYSSGAFTTTDDVGSGEMVVDPDDGSVWSTSAGSAVDIDTLFTTPDNMKWVYLLSDTGSFTEAGVVHEVTLNFGVGSANGTYPIGYVATVNSGNMLDYINASDQDDGVYCSAGVDTSFNHMVEVVGGTAGIDETELPTKYQLSQNYPNPFNPETTIDFRIDGDSHVNISVFGINGNLIQELVNEWTESGAHQVKFSGHSIPSGIYFYKITTKGFTDIRKMTLIQ